MDVNDTARVCRPRDAVEYRLGTVNDITCAPYTTYIQRVWLRFPNGDERSYTTAEIMPCSRDDDRTALIATMTEACRFLRDACHIAHDYDDELNAETHFLLTSLVATAEVRLGVTIDPARLPEPPHQATVIDPHRGRS